MANITIQSGDGTVHPIFTGGAASRSIWGTCGNTNLSLTVDPTATDAVTAATFYVGDHLGSAQMEFSASGTPLSLSQFMPFGGEINPPVTSNHYKFTGKERDTESGLDYFGRRYYGSSMGRFMSPDPHNPVLIRQGMIAGGLPEEAANSSFLGFLENPQNWNEYSYVRNNPLGFTDPTGAFPAPGDGHHLLVERGNISNPLAKDFATAIKTGGPNPASNTWSNASGHPAYITP